MRNGKWIGLAAVAFTVVLIATYKTQVTLRTPTADADALPRVLLVADLREADSEGDACAEIIRSVRAARTRGVAVQELDPGTKSDLLRRYQILTVPTVLILDPNGKVLSRFEGEGRQIVTAVRIQLDQLR
jgi:hypothetical protein